MNQYFPPSLKYWYRRYHLILETLSVSTPTLNCLSTNPANTYTTLKNEESFWVLVGQFLEVISTKSEVRTSSGICRPSKPLPRDEGITRVWNGRCDCFEATGPAAHSQLCHVLIEPTRAGGDWRWPSLTFKGTIHTKVKKERINKIKFDTWGIWIDPNFKLMIYWVNSL